MKENGFTMIYISEITICMVLHSMSVPVEAYSSNFEYPNISDIYYKILENRTYEREIGQSMAYVILQKGTIGPLFNESTSTVEICDSDYDAPEEFGPAECAFLSLTLGMLIATMIIGNTLVILAIAMEKELQRPQYYLVCSLAVADLMVGVVVSPLAALYDVNRQWHLGVPMCDFWILSDVLACTASILHLVAIALDRYWSITDVGYMQKRTATRIGYMIVVVWAISFGVSVAPILGWKDSQFHCRVEVRNECLISQDPSYQIFSTTTAFYGPLVLICILYWKIYKAAKWRIQMQVKRRSNTNVAQIKAKILASQQLQELTQDAVSMMGRFDGEETEYPSCMDNGHGPQMANGRRYSYKKEPLMQKPSNVEIRLIQPSSAEPTAIEAELATGAIRNGGRKVSCYSVAVMFPSQDTVDIRQSKYAKSKSEHLGSPVSEATALVPLYTAKEKCNGVCASGMKIQVGGGSIVTGPGGSVDFTIEDDTEYIDGGPAPQSPVLAPPSLSPPGRSSLSVPTSVRKSPSAGALSPRLPRYSNVSQSDISSITGAYNTTSAATSPSKRRRTKSKKESVESSRERRAGRTLAIITGIFVVSWLPFFILAVIRPLCPRCAIPNPVNSVCVWLGYVNSAINPIIYTIFSPDFRNAFRRTLRRFCLVRRRI